MRAKRRAIHRNRNMVCVTMMVHIKPVSGRVSVCAALFPVVDKPGTSLCCDIIIIYLTWSIHLGMVMAHFTQNIDKRVKLTRMHHLIYSHAKNNKYRNIITIKWNIITTINKINKLNLVVNTNLCIILVDYYRKFLIVNNQDQ